jgi:Zn-dependent alcohol dehydrogenase
MPTPSKAAILVEANQPLVIDQVTFPDPDPDQVLVRLFASGVCHSQLHQIHRTPQTAHRATPGVFPTLLGHEATGVVVAAGSQVAHVREGDHVMTTWVDRCAVDGAPRRSSARVQWGSRVVPAGPATWTEYALLSERLVVPLDRDVATDVTSIIGYAVLTGSGVILNTLQVRPNESVAVFGAGGVGLCAIAAAHIVGAYPVIAVDLGEEKLAFAHRFGATHGVDATQGDPVAAIRDLTGGGVDYAIDCVGAARTQEQILHAARPGGVGLRKGGTACLVGAAQEQGRIDSRGAAHVAAHLHGHPRQPVPAGTRLPDVRPLVPPWPARPRRAGDEALHAGPDQRRRGRPVRRAHPGAQHRHVRVAGPGRATRVQRSRLPGVPRGVHGTPVEVPGIPRAPRVRAQRRKRTASHDVARAVPPSPPPQRRLSSA